jgi:hypothetical protein
MKNENYDNYLQGSLDEDGGRSNAPPWPIKLNIKAFLIAFAALIFLAALDGVYLHLSWRGVFWAVVSVAVLEAACSLLDWGYWG